MKINSKAFFFLILTPVCLFFFFYLFWQPDTLVNYFPESTVFYFHFDLNSSSRIGFLTQKWLNQELIKNSFKEISSNSQFPLDQILKKENIDLLSEVGIIGIPSQGNDPNYQNQIVVLLKIRKWADFSLIKNNLSNLNLIQLNRRIWIASQSPVFLNKKENKNLNQNFLEVFNFKKIINPILGKGFFNIGFLDDQDNFSSSYKRLDFEIFSNSTLDGLFFSFIKVPEDFFKNQDPKTIDQIIINPKTEPQIVLFYKNSNGLKFFENELKKYFALSKPEETIRYLPDQTYFIESIANPEAFQFQQKIIVGQEVDYCLFEKKDLSNFDDGLNEKFEGKEIIVWKNDNHLFLTGNEKTFINFQKFFLDKNFLFEKYCPQKGGYLFFNKFGIKDILFMEVDGGNLGIIGFN